MEKDTQRKPKPSRGREIVKISTEINERETIKTKQNKNNGRIHEQNQMFLWKAQQNNKSLGRLIKKGGVVTQINTIMN